LAERDAGRKLKPSEVSNYYTKKALDFIVLSPGDAARLTLKKLHLFWAGIERSNDKYMQFFWRRFGLGRLPFPGFWLVGPLALLGGFLLARRWKRHALLYLFVLTYMASVVAFFVNGRFRLPVAPVLIVFASYACFHSYLAFRARSRDMLPVVAVLALAVFVVDYDYVVFRGVRSFDESVSFYELGNASLKAGDNAAALSYFEQAYAIQQKYPTRGYEQIAGNVDFNLGLLYWEKGLYSRAAGALVRVPDGDPRALQARALLADTYTKKGEPQEAIALYTKLLQTNPNDPRILYGLGFACRAAGDLERARQALEAGLRIQRPPDGSVHLELARTLELLGDADGALSNYEIASASPQQRRDATLEMARLLAKTGNREKALAYMEELLRAYPNDREIEIQANAIRTGR
jgi:tetratricopeptide (TPR) repeat protein